MKVGDLIRYVGGDLVRRGDPIEGDGRPTGLITKIDGGHIWYFCFRLGRETWSSSLNMEVISESR